MRGRSRRVGITLAAALLLAAASPAQAATVDGDPFPVYESIRGNVEFWLKVWGSWSMGQVAVHHYDHPALIYAVVDLPGPVEERYTDEQLDFVEALAEEWSDRLAELQRKIDAGAELARADKELALLVSSTAGTDVLQDAHARVRTQRGLRERFRRGLEISGRYEALIRKIFREAGLPEDLAYLPHVESSFQAEARSSAGAVGVWQFTRGTGRRYMRIGSALDERLDPVIAAYGAAAYLQDAFDALQDWPIALTSYNHGVQGMKRAVKKHGHDYEAIFNDYDGRLFGFASENFYAEFLAAREIASDPDRFFPEGIALERPLDLDTTVLEGRTTPARLARAYGVPLDELASINPAWTRRALQAGLALPKGLTVWLPAGTHARLDDEGREPDDALAGWVDEGGSYVVQPGDSLSVIADSFRIAVTRLRQLNGMAPDESLIRVGQKLRVAAPLATHTDVHIVRRGDTLLRIAFSYGVKLADLLQVNSLTERSIIHPGQKIRIP